MRNRFAASIALVGFFALSSGISFAAHMRQECCHHHDATEPVEPHSTDECPVCQGLLTTSTALVGGVVVVVAPLAVTGFRHPGPAEPPHMRFVESPASPRAPPAH